MEEGGGKEKWVGGEITGITKLCTKGACQNHEGGGMIRSVKLKVQS